MTPNEATRKIEALRQIKNMQVSSVFTWLALLEDELQRDIPNSQLFARFKQIKDESSQSPHSSSDIVGDSQVVARLRSDCSELIDAVCASLASLAEPTTRVDLTDEVERIIQKGYFKSVYFRLVLGGLGLALLLVTGVEGYNLSAQVKAMQQLVADARKQVEDGRVEIAKNNAETRDRQAQFALALLQGNEEMVKLRTTAMQQITEEQDGFRSRIEQQANTAASEITKAASTGNQAVINAQNNAVAGISTQAEKSNNEIDQVLQRGKSTVANKLSSTITALDAAKNPWVPAVVWSIAKTSIMIPFTLIIAALTLMTTLTPIAQARIGQFRLGNVVTILNIVIVLSMLVIVLRLR